jgi:hypothetical protein
MTPAILALANLAAAAATLVLAARDAQDPRRRRRRVVWAAGATVLAFIATQIAMPDRMDIRVDLLVTAPATVVAMGLGLWAAGSLRRER